MNATEYQKLPLKQQFNLVIGHADTTVDVALTSDCKNKFFNDVAAQRGLAMQRAKVTSTVWKSASLIPVTVRKDYPALIAFAALETAYLASFSAAQAARWAVANITKGSEQPIAAVA